jgi:steroid delta-isomerase-like uncharacterized protein
MSAETNDALGRLFFAEQDRLRGGPADEFCASEYTACIGGNPPMNLAGHKQFAAMFYAAFPDIKHIIEDTVASEDSVAVRFRLRGTQTGDFMGIPATGKPIAVSAIVIMRISDGKVTELKGVFDQFGLMQQLGVIPG